MHAKATTEYSIGFPVSSKPADLKVGFVSGELPTCEVYSFKHTGPYRHLGNAWSTGMMYARAKAFKQNKKIHPFEIYENDPKEVEENALMTTVHFPSKG